MNINWIPGQKISKLPKIIRPFALISRNFIVLAKRRLGNKLINRRYSDADVRHKLSMGVEYICGCLVEGDVAEFGTASGATAKIIARSLKMLDQKKVKKIHLFDSFEGLPAAESNVDATADMITSGKWSEKSFLELDEQKLKRLVQKYLPSDRIVIYKGWFKDTLKLLPLSSKLAMVHIDCDLYSSSREVLFFLFANKIIQPGAIIFFDDYNANHASPELGERKAWSETIEKFQIIFSDGGDYGTGSKKFIIHSYHE